MSWSNLKKVELHRIDEIQKLIKADLSKNFTMLRNMRGNTIGRLDHYPTG